MKRFTESQIVATIKKQESGFAAKEFCREIGITTLVYKEK